MQHPALNHCPAGVEALRVYLILPELLRVLLKQQLGTNLAVSLAEAILKLCPDLLKVLGEKPLILYTLTQGSQTPGPRARSGPPSDFIRPAVCKNVYRTLALCTVVCKKTKTFICQIFIYLILVVVQEGNDTQAHCAKQEHPVPSHFHPEENKRDRR